jgi:hypothetical protein
MRQRTDLRWSDDDDEDCEGQYFDPSYCGGPVFSGRVPAYNRYGYNSGYSDAYDNPYYDNGSYRRMSTLAPLLQQFFR